jgi:hypothetical protein
MVRISSQRKYRLHRLYHAKSAILLLIFWAATGLLSCSQNEKGFTVEDERKIGIIMDLHIAEAAMAKVPDKFKDSLRMQYRTDIAEIHGLSPDGLDSLVLKLQNDAPKFKKLTSEAMLRMDSLERSLH